MPKASRGKDELRVSFLPGDTGRKAGGIFRVKNGVVILAAVIIVVAMAGGYFYFAARRTDARARGARENSSVNETRLAQRESALSEALHVARMAGAAKLALARHINAAQALVVLERSAVTEVQLKQISLDTKGTAVIVGSGRNYDAVIRQILSWNEDMAIRSMRISGVLAKTNPLGAIEGIQFNATLTFEPEVFIAQPI